MDGGHHAHSLWRCRRRCSTRRGVTGPPVRFRRAPKRQDPRPRGSPVQTGRTLLAWWPTISCLIVLPAGGVAAAFAGGRGSSARRLPCGAADRSLRPADQCQALPERQSHQLKPTAYLLSRESARRRPLRARRTRSLCGTPCRRDARLPARNALVAGLLGASGAWRKQQTRKREGDEAHTASWPKVRRAM